MEVANWGGGGVGGWVEGGGYFRHGNMSLAKREYDVYKHTVRSRDLNLSLKMSFHSELEKETMIF